MVAARVLEVIAEPLRLQSHEISVSASVGIALYPRDGADGERLLKSADAAMYRAKDLGRNRYEFFARASPARASIHSGESLRQLTR